MGTGVQYSDPAARSFAQFVLNGPCLRSFFWAILLKAAGIWKLRVGGAVRGSTLRMPFIHRG